MAWTPNEVRELVAKHVPSVACVAPRLVQVNHDRYEAGMTSNLPLYLQSTFKRMVLVVYVREANVLRIEWQWTLQHGGTNGYTLFYEEIPT